MRDLIEALKILQKYKNCEYPTNCGHDILCIPGIRRSDVSPADEKRLKELGFFWSTEFDCWASFRFGRC